MKSKQLVQMLAVAATAIIVTACQHHGPRNGHGNGPVFYADFCPELGSYTSPQAISDIDAKRVILNYENSVNPGDITGGIITGNTIENIFCERGTNALSYRIARDTTGEIAHGQLFIVVTGASVSQDENGAYTVVQTGSNLYIPNNWCPPHCIPVY